jgi:hypothetical protein
MQSPLTAQILSIHLLLSPERSYQPTARKQTAYPNKQAANQSGDASQFHPDRYWSSELTSYGTFYLESISVSHARFG